MPVALLQPAGGCAGPTIGGRYRLSRRVSGSDRSEVWEAWDTVLERPVRVRLAHPDDVPTAASRLSVTGALDVYDVVDHGSMAAVVTERVEAWSLEGILDQGVTIRPGDVVRIVAGVADVLAEAHARGVPHGALRPSNVLLTDDGGVHLSDFRGRPPGAGRLDPAPDLEALGRLLADLLERCPPGSTPPHLSRLAKRRGPTGRAAPVSLLEFRLALDHPDGTVEPGAGRGTGRWLVAVAAIVATVAVAAAASRILDGGGTRGSHPAGVEQQAG